MSRTLRSCLLLVLAIVPGVAGLGLPRAARAQEEVEYPAGGPGECRAIWHTYGRYSWGEGGAAWCEMRDLGTLPARATVIAEGRGGDGVRATGAARQATRVWLVIQATAPTREQARALAAGVSLDLSADTLRPRGTGRRDGGRAAAVLVLETPRHADLVLSTESGPLEVEDVQGRMSLAVTNGPLALSAVGGDVRARAENGPIDITLAGDHWDGAGLDAAAQNGPVSLEVPRGYSAELDASTENGPFSIDYPLPVRAAGGHAGAHRLTTTLGKGGATVRAVAENGPLSIAMER